MKGQGSEVNELSKTGLVLLSFQSMFQYLGESVKGLRSMSSLKQGLFYCPLLPLVPVSIYGGFNRRSRVRGQ